ncbi:UNVERIFIED_CONTAM: hypothetical protein FKN15_049540 [Acipenser sinensis]
MPLSDSSYHKEEGFQNLESEVIHFQTLGSVLLCGDLNARTGRDIDYISTEGNSPLLGDTPLYHTQAKPQRCGE